MNLATKLRHMTPDGMEFLKRQESCRLIAYCDLCGHEHCTCETQKPAEHCGGKWSIGYGATMLGSRPVVEGDQCTQTQADGMLRNKVTEIEVSLMRYLSKYPIPQTYKFDAIVSLCYNIGTAAFGRCNAGEGSQILQCIRKGDFEKAGDHFLDWHYVINKDNRGLRARRVRERELFLTGNYTYQPSEDDVKRIYAEIIGLN